MWKLIKAEFKYNKYLVYTMLALLFIANPLIYLNSTYLAQFSEYLIAVINIIILTMIYIIHANRVKEKRDEVNIVLSQKTINAAAARVGIYLATLFLILINNIILFWNIRNTSAYGDEIFLGGLLFTLAAAALLSEDAQFFIRARNKFIKAIMILTVFAACVVIGLLLRELVEWIHKSWWISLNENFRKFTSERGGFILENWEIYRSEINWFKFEIFHYLEYNCLYIWGFILGTISIFTFTKRRTYLIR